MKRLRVFQIHGWQSFVAAIESAQAAAMNDPEPEDDDSLTIHRDVEGEHAETAKNCWCGPFVFMRSDLERMTAEEIAEFCARKRVDA